MTRCINNYAQISSLMSTKETQDLTPDEHRHQTCQIRTDHGIGNLHQQKIDKLDVDRQPS